MAISSDTRKAVLTDLDGVFFKLVDYPSEFRISARREADIEIVEGLGAALDALSAAGFLIIAHTNQPDIARGKITVDFLAEKHRRLMAAYPQIQKIYVCPHTDSDNCDCRKPKPGMLLMAQKDFNLDLSRSWVVGDSPKDIQAAEAAHVNAVLVMNESGPILTKDRVDTAFHIVETSEEAFRFIAGQP